MKFGPGRQQLQPSWLTCRFMAIAIAVAYLPSLTFLGHWNPPQLEIPGTSYYLGLPAVHHVHHDDGADHETHCHENLASCSDGPVTAGATVALLGAVLAFLMRGGLLSRCDARWWLPHTPLSLTPDLRPPR
ncbi:hypothetical protein AYO38_09635 [bacterium SCGC AG-212-C10]|nr:hypothetical protein AYO38_09635 [bacterium SCGC AG-212-C10]